MFPNLLGGWFDTVSSSPVSYRTLRSLAPIVSFYFFQTELREVFEGSCQLIPIKLIANECIKLADQFVPELVETLASEMNPDTVCSVAGNVQLLFP